MLFGHLSAEDFTNLLEGAALPERRHAHLRSCPRCAHRLTSVRQMRTEIEEVRTESDDFIPEPDWSEFRSDVRNALLSRSVKRETAAKTWFGGLGFKPALAWGVSMMLVFGITLTGVLWNQRPAVPEAAQIVAVEEVGNDDIDLNSLEGMSRKDVFDDLLHLDMAEAESLEMILADVAPSGVSQQ